MTRMAFSLGPKTVTLFVATLCLVLLTGPGMSQAQTTDITSSGLNTTVGAPTILLNGMINHDITGGSRPGNGPNLFHSFGEFSVATNHIANFLNETATPTTNILSRVTGGNPSNIFGLLQTTDFGAANLYLINPAGVIFGPTASLNVGGSFAASTADYLKMADGAKFSANPAPATVLSIAPVVAFGFLNGNPAAISIQRSVGGYLGGADLSVPTGATMSFVGGDLTLTAEPILGQNFIPAVSAPSGVIQLASMKGPGEVPVNLAAFNMSTVGPLGAITLSQGALMSVSSDATGRGGGTVVLRGGNLTLDNAYIFADTIGTQNGARLTIDVQLTGDALITNGSSITADVGGAGNAGNIQVMATNLELSNESLLGSRSFGTGNAGNVTIQAQTLTVADGAQVSSTTLGPGQGGTISVTADSVTLRGASANGLVSSGLFANAEGTAPGAGSAGNITLQAQTLTVADGAQVSSTTLGPGQGGDIAVTADTIALRGTSPDQFASSGLVADAEGTAPGAGSAGNITLQAQTLTVADGAQVASGTSGQGAGGTISVTADTVTLRGASANGLVSSGLFANAQGQAPGVGSAGNVTIQAQTLTVADGAQVSSTTFGPGQGGDIAVTADTIVVQGRTPDQRAPSGLFARARSTAPGAGSAGNVTLQAQTLTVADGAQVVSGTSGPGAGGTISVTADSVTLRGTSTNGRVGSGLFANTQGQAPGAGSAGNVTLQLQTLTVADGAQVASGTSGPGRGGDIAVTADTIVLSGIGTNGLIGSGLFASTQGQALGAGSAGNVTLQVQTLTVADGAQVASGTSGPGRGGDIAVTADTIVLQGTTPDGRAPSGLFANAQGTAPGAGSGGNVTIQAQTLMAEGGAGVASSTHGPGAGGTVGITANTITLRGKTLDGLHASGVFATAHGAGNAGLIIVNAGRVNMTSTAEITSSSNSFASDAGNAGQITIQGSTGSGRSATSVSLDNSTISTTINGGSSTTQSATIDITAQTVNLTNGAQIKADTSGVAPAGSINITGGNVTLSSGSALTSQSTSADATAAGAAGQINIAASGILQTGGATVSTSANQGKGGNVTLQAGNDLNLLNGTVMSAETTGTGATANGAGDIHLVAGDNLTLRDVLVSTKTVSANASGGSIKLTAPNLIRLVNSTITSSVLGQAGSNGGNITIDPQLVVIQNSQLLANAFAGAGGNITIAASGAVLIDPNSLLSASAGPAGVSGSVNINAPIQVLSGALVPLNLVYSQAGLSGDRCAADPKGQFSSFVQTGRDGVPQVPGALSPSPLSFLDTLTSGSLESPMPNLAAARLGLDSVSYDDSTIFRFHSACRS